MLVLCQGARVFCKIFFRIICLFWDFFKRGGKIQFFGNRGNSVLENDGLRPMTLDMSEVEIISLAIAAQQ